jgi:nucleoside-diphosphate-sugar epimerase
MRIALTGATGFIGRNLLNALANRGHTICLLLRSEHPQVEFPSTVEKISFDLKEEHTDFLERIGNPDMLIHLAWGGLPNYRSTHHFESELPLHFNFLKRVIRAGVKKIVVAGTCFEYGAVSGCVDESHPTNPTNPYGHAKDSLRRQLEFLRLTCDFELTWSRIFYLFGDGQPSGSLLPLLDAAIDRGDKFFPMTQGEQLRDYMSVREVAETLASLVLSNCDCGVVNLCSGTPVSVRRIVEGRIKELGSEIKPLFGALDYSDIEPLAFWGSRKKLDSLLGK